MQPNNDFICANNFQSSTFLFFSLIFPLFVSSFYRLPLIAQKSPFILSRLSIDSITLVQSLIATVVPLTEKKREQLPK